MQARTLLHGPHSEMGLPLDSQTRENTTETNAIKCFVPPRPILVWRVGCLLRVVVLLFPNKICHNCKQRHKLLSASSDGVSSAFTHIQFTFSNKEKQTKNKLAKRMHIHTNPLCIYTAAVAAPRAASRFTSAAVNPFPLNAPYTRFNAQKLQINSIDHSAAPI